MNTLPYLLLGLGSGIVGGLLGGLLIFSPASAPPAESGSGGLAAAPGDPASDAGKRLTALESEMETLSMIVNDLQSRLQERRAVAQVDVEADGPLAAAAPQESASGQEDQVDYGSYFDQRVEAVLQQREEEQQKEREERARQFREQRIEQQVAQLTEKLGLDDYQAGELKTALTREDQERTAFFRDLRNTGNFDRQAIGEKMRSLREETFKALAPIMGPEKMRGLKEFNARNSSFFGGGGPSRDRSDRGGNGDRGGRDG
ncbi:MAG: hypothetical protein ACE5H3_05365 [Planctomycetota bacterium]